MERANEPTPRHPGFAEAWAELEPQLRRSLAAAPAHLVDDVLQDTSIKLLRVWDSIDHDRPALPLAVTIARNTLRDELRRSARHAHAELSEEARVRDDLDAVVSARLELAKVGSELTRLTPAQQAALLAEVGRGPRQEDTPRIKMLRSRARARLRELVAQAGGFVATGFARLRSSVAGRAAAGAPELGMLAQAVVLAVVVAGTAASTGIVPGPRTHPGRARMATAADEVARAVGREGRVAPGPAALGAAGPAGSSEVTAVPPAGGHGGATPSRPGLPTPPIPRSHGGVHDDGYFGTEGWTQAGDGANSVAGHDAAYRYETEWESPACVQRVAEGRPPGRCDAPESPSAAVEVQVDGERHRVSTDDGGRSR